MKTKKFIALLMAALMMLAVVSCGKKDETKTNQTEAPVEATQAATEAGKADATVTNTDVQPAEITIWTYPIGKFGDRETVDTLIGKFNQKYPDIKVTLELLDYQNGDTQVTGAITAGTTPDIIMEGPERLVANYAAAGKMVDLSDLWTEDAQKDIAATSEAIVNACQLDGKFYEYPLCMTAHTMAINYDAFKEADALKYLDEEKRTWTTDNFIEALKALKAHGSIPVNGIVYCGGTGGDQGTRALVNNLYSGKFTDAEHTKYTANSPENVKALTKLQELVNEGLLNSDAAFVANDELQAFANKTAAMSFCWNASNKDKYAEQTDFKTFAMAFPTDNGQPELCGGIWGFGVFDNKDANKAAAAKEFIKFICDDAEQAAESVRLTGFFPAKSSLGNVYVGTPNEETANEFLKLMPYLGDYYNVTPNWPDQRTNWFNLLQQVFNGDDVQTAADNYVQQSNK